MSCPFHAWTANSQRRATSEMLLMLERMSANLDKHDDWDRVGIDANALHVLIAHTEVEIFQWRREMNAGVGTLRRRSDLRKSYAGIMQMCLEIDGAIFGREQFKRRFGPS